MKTKNNRKARVCRRVLNVALASLVAFASVAFATAKWYLNRYGDIGFDSILFTMFSELSGVESGLFIDYICKTFIVSLLAATLIIFLLFFDSEAKIYFRLKTKSIRVYPFAQPVRSILCIAFFAVFTIKASGISGLTEYVKASMSDSKIFDKEYVHPADTSLAFPENKRNLIYIYLESMENTFFDISNGGAYAANVVPELYSLAKNNVNFSQTGGGRRLSSV